MSKGCKLRGVAQLRRETIDLLAMQHGSSGGEGVAGLRDVVR